MDLNNPDNEQWPEAQGLKFVDCILEEGQMLYIPPKWWHYVQSLSPSFSVSFWWTTDDNDNGGHSIWTYSMKGREYLLHLYFEECCISCVQEASVPYSHYWFDSLWEHVMVSKYGSILLRHISIFPVPWCVVGSEISITLLTTVHVKSYSEAGLCRRFGDVLNTYEDQCWWRYFW